MKCYLALEMSGVRLPSRLREAYERYDTRRVLLPWDGPWLPCSGHIVSMTLRDGRVLSWSRSPEQCVTDLNEMQTVLSFPAVGEALFDIEFLMFFLTEKTKALVEIASEPGRYVLIYCGILRVEQESAV